MASTTKSAVTLAEVARQAGVSIATVSKVLNRRSDVAAPTRARVEAALEHTGYQRPTAFRSQSSFIELLFFQLDNEWALEIIRGVEAEARAAGFGVLLGESGTAWDAPSAEWIEGVLQRQPAGLLLVFAGLPPEYRERLRSRGIPYTVIDPTGDTLFTDVSAVGSGNWAGGMMAARHLVELGHRRIGVISGPEAMLCSLARVDGYRSALAAAGVAVDPELVRFGNFDVPSGERHAEALLALPEPPTAIFAGNDLQALGVYEAAERRGLRIPQDLSVVGYDDLPVVRWTRPKMTTVHQPLFEMAVQATRMVLDQRGEAGARPQLDLRTRLVVRDSTAAPGR